MGKIFIRTLLSLSAEQVARQQAKHKFARAVLSVLPYERGVTLAELQKILISKGIKQQLVRPALLLEALQHLYHAGLVATTANQSGDDFTHRRYWRVSASDLVLQP